MKKRTLFSFADALLVAVMLFVVGTTIAGEAAGLVLGGLAIATAIVPMPAYVLGMNNTNNASARESFQHAKRMFFRAFRDKFPQGPQGDQLCQQWVENLKLSQSEIRLEVQLIAAQNTFVFGVTPNQANTNNTQFNTERRLPLQDSICVNEYAVLVGNPATATDTNWQLHTYGNQIDFGAAPGTNLDGSFFSNGSLAIRCNNDVIMPYRGLYNHHYKGQTQQTAALGAASPEDQYRGAEDGFITDEPNIVIIGSKNYVPTIELPVGLVSVTTFERAVLIMRGVYAQNSTVVS